MITAFINCFVVVTCVLICDSSVLLVWKGHKILGKKLVTVLENKQYAAFYNIPYAEPPVGELRFKPPKRRQFRSDGDNTVYNYKNTQRQTSNTYEDCLYLSIFRPTTTNKTNYFPVMVWTHENSNNHGPDFYIDEGILVVMVSFRISLFGFLNTGDDFAAGNMGAKDILMALSWIRENIHVFNGDSTRVTIIGSGEATTVVASLILSSAAEDLFTRVIIQSGSALSPADYSNYNFKISSKLYWKLRGPFKKFDRNIFYKTLYDASAGELILSSRDLFDSTEVRDNQRLINSFGCSVEVPKKYYFMNRTPLEIYSRKLTNNNVQVMMGYTNLECLYKLSGYVKNRILLKYLNYNFLYLLPFEGGIDEYESRRYRKIRKKIMDFYFLNGTIGERSLRRYSKYVSDLVIYPLLRQALLHNEVSCANVYLYRFAFNGAFNYGWKTSVPELKWSGATAGDEICYLLRCESQTDVYKKGDVAIEIQLIKKMTRLFGNFVKYGDPTPVKEDKLLGKLRWLPLRNGKLRGMNFGRNITMVNLPEEKRMMFWNQLKRDFYSDDLNEEL